MNTSIIKKETQDQCMQPVVKISRRTGSGTLRKNDLLTMLREENDSLYDDYHEVIKRNIELRAIVEKQQKLINAIYNAELNLVFPVDEKNTVEQTKTEAVQLEIMKEPVSTLPLDEPITLDESIAIEEKKPDIIPPQPLSIDDLAKRIWRLQRKQWQSQKSVIEKTKFLLAIYHAPSGIHCDTLFANCGIIRVTGIRYVNFFRKFSMVSSGGTYTITVDGKKFVEGEPNPEWDKYTVKKWRTIR
jgi:hypothetical protein